MKSHAGIFFFYVFLLNIRIKIYFEVYCTKYCFLCLAAAIVFIVYFTYFGGRKILLTESAVPF